MAPSVTLLMPTLNEETGMRAIMPRVDPAWCQQILVVDGGSTDGTVDYAREHGYEVYVQKQRGLRYAYSEAFPLVRGDIVVTFSPDGNSIPELIPAVAAKVASGDDMVIVSRYLDEARSHDDDVITGFGNWFFTSTINLLHRARYTDAMVMFRAYRTRLYYELELDREEGYAMERWLNTTLGVEPLLSIRAAKRRCRISEIPGDEPVREGGERKLQVIRWGSGYLWQTIRELYYWR